ncbi:MFS transporter [Kineococcus radiotolerans]|uniref:Major facilitator superfamily MFS_1 n=1 Tax=Kineococcus radiotolerans (strain ATCC BAA-149 / DSM 14245 / SRS30216) TaxID=266940 RepID=A6WBI7_KINRD|nr:MFS transporter [Kineococcus radiotolerans]ABS04176.1 major facilitator superfamily MFS_1 [Kineococcus radiotolerans SRS30216 = ATCC BAA-149]
MALAPSPVPVRAARARAGVSALFFTNAVLYANLVPRLPEIKDRLDLSNAALGTAIAAMPLGALLAGLLASAFIQRWGSATVGALGLMVLAAAVAVVPLSSAWLVLAAVMLVIGALDAVVDVAQNAHGFRVQRLYGRSIVNAFHGLWSVGAVVGGLLGAAAAGAGVPLGLHLGVSALVFGLVALVARRSLLPGPEDSERTGPQQVDGTGAGTRTGTQDSGAAADDPARGRSARRPGRRWGRAGVRTAVLLAVLGALAASGALVEDAGSSWGALYLRGELGAGAAVGGLAFVSLQAAQTIGRLTGDRVVDRFGQRRVALAGGGFTAAGMGAALAWPSVPGTLIGFALAGLGVATLVPAVMHTADELPGLPPGAGLTVVSWLLRIGFLVSPTLVGFAADAAGLRVALLSVVVAGLLVLVLGRFLDPATGPGGHSGAGATTRP